MKFPITRESLQSFDPVKEQDEIKEEEMQKGLTQILEKLCEGFKKSMHYNSKEKKFVWHINNVRLYYDHGTYLYSDSTIDDLLPRIIEKLKEIFIGCDISIDPLIPSIIIDWS